MNDLILWNNRAGLSPAIQGKEFIPLGSSTRWVRGDMVLGNAHAGCRGAGICKISMQGQMSIHNACGCGCIPVLLVYISSHCIQLIVDKQDLRFSQRMKHFKLNRTNIHKDIPLNPRLRVALGYSTSVSVEQQRVELQENKYYYYFFLNVSIAKI